MKEYRDVVDRCSGLCFIRSEGSFESSEKAAVILPGAQCEAHRYRWLLRGLVENGIAGLIIDPPLLQRQEVTHAAPSRMVTIPELALGLNVLGEAGARDIFVIGHSYGGTVLLDALDAEEAKRNPMHQIDDSFAGLTGIAGGITMGTSLQPGILGLDRPWRHATRPLYRPADVSLLMIAASCDGLVPPPAVKATAVRYSPPPRYQVLEGGTHFGWTELHGPHDQIDRDGKARVTRFEQQAKTVELCRDFICEARCPH